MTFDRRPAQKFNVRHIFLFVNKCQSRYLFCVDTEFHLWAKFSQCHDKLESEYYAAFTKIFAIEKRDQPAKKKGPIFTLIAWTLFLKSIVLLNTIYALIFE